MSWREPGVKRGKDGEVKYVKIRGMKIGDRDPEGWTTADVDYWNGDGPAPTCNYKKGTRQACTTEAMSGNARCRKHQGK